MGQIAGNLSLMMPQWGMQIAVGLRTRIFSIEVI